MVCCGWTRRMMVDILTFIRTRKILFHSQPTTIECWQSVPLRHWKHVQSPSSFVPFSELISDNPLSCSPLHFSHTHLFKNTETFTTMLLARPALRLAARRSLFTVPAVLPRTATRTFASQSSSGGGGGGGGGSTLIAVVLGAAAGVAGYRYYFQNDRKFCCCHLSKPKALSS